MKTAWTFLAFLALRALAVSGATYGYTIFYVKGSTCANSAVSLVPWVSGEDFEAYGARRRDQVCSTESLCAVNPESEQCQSLGPGVEVLVNFTVLPNGTELLCQNATDCVVTPRCSGTAAHPNCSVSSVSQAALLTDPSLIQNTQFPTSAITETSYFVYYNDSQCLEFVGLYGFVSGNNSAVNITTTGEEISCYDSMACLYNSAGPSCQAAGPNGTIEVVTLVSANGSEVTGCTDRGCNVRVPSQCSLSSFYPRCYFRRISGKVLFENPSLYLTPPAPAPAAGPTPAGPTPAGPTSAGPTSARTSSALQKTHRPLGAGLAFLQTLLF